MTDDLEFFSSDAVKSGGGEALMLQIDSADSGGKEGSASSREEADARSVFVGNVNISLLFIL